VGQDFKGSDMKRPPAPPPSRAEQPQSTGTIEVTDSSILPNDPSELLPLPAAAGGMPYKKPFFVLLISCLLLAGLAGYLFFGYARPLGDRIEELAQGEKTLTAANLELSASKEQLSGQVAALEKRLADEVSRLTREKEQEVQKVRGSAEEELSRLKGTQDQMRQTLQGEIDRGQVQITQLADRLSVNIVDKILFPSGQAEISEEGKVVLERVGKVLAGVKDKVIRIEGHTDNQPIGKNIKERFPTNWELSVARATNVVRFLQEQAGVDASALEAVGLGENQPIASNRNARSRAKNRRIEIVLYPKVKSLAQAAKQAPGHDKR
jgi:chemotaxis protein MotB